SVNVPRLGRPGAGGDPRARFFHSLPAPPLRILLQMADYFQTVIDTKARPDDADHLARHVVQFLAEKGVIDGNPSEEGGYPRGPHARATAAPERPHGHETIPPVYTPLQVMIGRAVHAADMSETRMPGAACPACGAPLDDPDEEWPAAVQAWLAGDNDS